jgi:hypothetical protein
LPIEPLALNVVIDCVVPIVNRIVLATVFVSDNVANVFDPVIVVTDVLVFPPIVKLLYQT